MGVERDYIRGPPPVWSRVKGTVFLDLYCPLGKRLCRWLKGKPFKLDHLLDFVKFFCLVISKGWRMIFPQTLKGPVGIGLHRCLRHQPLYCHTATVSHCHPSKDEAFDSPGFAVTRSRLGDALTQAETSFQGQLQHVLTLRDHAWALVLVAKQTLKTSRFLQISPSTVEPGKPDIWVG